MVRHPPRTEGIFTIFDDFDGFGVESDDNPDGTGDFTQWTHVRSSSLTQWRNPRTAGDYQDAARYAYDFDDGVITVLGLTGMAIHFMHTADPIESRTFAFLVTLDTSDASTLQCARFFVGTLAASLDDAPLTIEYCYQAGKTIVKSLNNVSGSGCDLLPNDLRSVDLTVTVEWTDGGHVTFVEIMWDVCWCSGRSG